MRKPSKKRIEVSKGQYVEWMKSIGPRIDRIPSARRTVVYGWTSDILDRILSGELGMTTAAFIRSVERECENWESGYYTEAVDGRACRIAV